MRPVPDGGDKTATRRLRALHSMAASITDLDIPFMLERTAEIVKSCLDFDELCILLEGRSGFVPCTCWSRRGPCGKQDIHVVDSVLHGALRIGQPFVARTTVQIGEGALEERISVHAAACPMVAAGRTIGILFCTRYHPLVGFRAEDVQFLSLVASFAASSISHQWNLAHAQRSMAKLEAVLGSLREGVLVCDQEFRVVSANYAARRLLGARKLIGIELEQLLDGFIHNFERGSVVATRAFDLERHSARDDDRNIFSYRATLSSLSTRDDLGPQYILCIRDVSLERFNELLQLRVVHRLAHKLRTPLTVLRSASSILEERLTERERDAGELLRLVHENTSKLSEIVDRFLDYTATEDQRPGLALSELTVPLDYILTQALGLAAEEVHGSGLEIVDRVGPLRDLELVVNPERLCRAFHQVIQNACKFAGAGAVLTIEAKLDDSLRIRFADDGPGVAGDDIKALFDLFHQVDGENTGEIPGLGLGLWWTREAIRGHGGEVFVDSPAASGRGLMVELRLPRFRVVESAREASSAPSIAQVSERGRSDELAGAR